MVRDGGPSFPYTAGLVGTSPMLPSGGKQQGGVPRHLKGQTPSVSRAHKVAARCCSLTCSLASLSSDLLLGLDHPCLTLPSVPCPSMEAASSGRTALVEGCRRGHGIVMAVDKCPSLLAPDSGEDLP